MSENISIDKACIIDCSFQPIDLLSPLNSPSSETEKKSKGKQKSYRKKVESAWSHENIMLLIKEVEARRSLWDAGCPEYKLPKDVLRQEVADSIPASFNDCKGKWANLRISFNWNLEKLRKKSLAKELMNSFQLFEGTSSLSCFWRPQKFAISSLQLESATTDEGLINDLGLSEELSISPCTNMQKRRRKSTPTTSSNSDLKEMAIDALQTLRSSDPQPKDTFAAFGEYISAELRSLPPESAAFARAKLRRAFNDILDEVSLMETTQREQQ